MYAFKLSQFSGFGKKKKTFLTTPLYLIYLGVQIELLSLNKTRLYLNSSSFSKTPKVLPKLPVVLLKLQQV